MKQTKWLPKYTEEINQLAIDHSEALSAIYIDAFNEGMKVGNRNALICVAIAAAIGVVTLCVVQVTYLEHKKR